MSSYLAQILITIYVDMGQYIVGVYLIGSYIDPEGPGAYY
jgi:hypothetical protein